MNKIKTVSIKFKIVFLSVVLAAIFLGVSFGYSMWQVRGELIESATQRLEIETAFERTEINLLLDEVKSILFSLKGTPPIQGLDRAAKNEGLDSISNSTFDQWINRLQDIFVAEIRSVDFILQLRYINQDGKEMVRVDSDNGRTNVILSQDLQDKSDRNYFLETKTLAEDQIYISVAELNREGSPPAISEPHLPTLRYATPVYSSADQLFAGIIIVNIDLDQLIQRAELTIQPLYNTFIVDQKGFFILHPDKSKTWGGANNLNTGYNIDSQFFKGFTDSLIGNEGSFIHNDIFYSYAKMKILSDNPSSSGDWTIIESIPTDLLFSPIAQLMKRSALVGFITFLILFFTFLFVIQYLLKPLSDLMQAAELLGKGNFDQRIKIRSHDEIGVVAQSFNDMSGRLKQIYGTLERQIKAKTKKLNNRLEDLERSQLAMTNILDDIETEKGKFEAVLRSIGDGVFVVDQNLKILIFNEAASHLSGYTNKQAIGKRCQSVLKFVDEKTKKVNCNFIKAIFKEGQTVSAIEGVDLKRRDGTYISVSITAAPLINSENQIIGVVVVFRDVSQQREIDRAKTEFVSLASHQLRTPLTSINWHAEMLLSGDVGKLKREQKTFVNEIYAGNQRMVQLVNSLLNVSRIELGTFAIEPEEVNLKDLVLAVLKDLKSVINQKKMKIEESYNEEALVYNGDPKLLTMIFQNLISNALKYTDNKGLIEISIDTDQQNNWLHIKVKDNGWGIPKSQQEKIFTKLFRADNVKQKDASGTGLGLYIIKAIIESASGEIWLKSTEGKGTTFFINLPLAGMESKEGSKPLEQKISY